MSFHIKNILKSELYRHSLFGVFFNIVCAIINICIIMLLSRIFSKEEFARYVLFLICTNLVALLALQGYGPIISKAIINNNHLFVKTALKGILIFSIKIMPIYYIGIYIYFVITNNVDMVILLGLAGLFIPLHACDKAEVIFTGLNRFKKLRWVKLFNAAFNLLLTGSAAYFTRDLTYVFLTLTVSRIISITLGMKMALSHINCKLQGEAVELEKEAKQLSLLSIFNVVSENIDKIALYNLGSVGLANFHTGSNIALKIKDYAKIAANTPVMAWLKNGDDYFKVKMKKFYGLLFVGTFLFCIALALLAQFYIPLLFGEKYSDAIPVAQIMSFTILTNVCGGVLGTRMIIKGDVKVYQLLNYLKTSLYLFFILPMIYMFREVGAACLILIVSSIHYYLLFYFYQKEAKKLV